MREERLHLYIGFYPDGSYVSNTVRDCDLEANIEYNKHYRPGRTYFVDGEYACGGMFEPEAQARFIETCKERIGSLGRKPESCDTRPYI